MKSNIRTIQISFVSIGIFLILATYYFYPKITGKKIIKSEVESIGKENNIILDGKEGNLFENVEYKGIYNSDNTFSVKSEKAIIFDESPDEVLMNNMHVTLYMNDGRIINITSDTGTYNKVNYNCFFRNNVKATDGETVILSKNLDLISKENYASVYNDVILTSDKDSLIADKIRYDFETELYDISMFDGKMIKIKLIKWIILKNLEL